MRARTPGPRTDCVGTDTGTAAVTSGRGWLGPGGRRLDGLLDRNRSALANGRIRTAQVALAPGGYVRAGIRTSVDPDVNSVRYRFDLGTGNGRRAAGRREQRGRDKVYSELGHRNTYNAPRALY